MSEIVSGRHEAGPTPLRNAHEQLLSALAWTQLVVTAADEPGDWANLPGPVEAYLQGLQRVFLDFDPEGPIPRVPRLVSLLWSGHGLDHPEESHRVAFVESISGQDKSFYDYKNIWNPGGLDHRTGRRIGVTGPPEPEPTWNRRGIRHQALRARFRPSVLGPSIGQAALSSIVLWEGGNLDLTPKENGEYCFLELSRPGSSRFRMVARIPEEATEAVVTIDHAYAARWFLPHAGRATIRLCIGGGGPEHLLQAPLGRSRSSFSVDEFILADLEHLELRVELESANATYRIYGAEIEFQWPERD